MTDREKFEAWFRAEIVAGRMYGSDEDGAWATWHASRRAALDHCTDVLANVAAHGGDMSAAIGLIRALSQKDPQ